MTMGWQLFLRYGTKGTKEKTDELDYIKIKDFFCIKVYCQQNGNATHRMTENICESYIW